MALNCAVYQMIDWADNFNHLNLSLSEEYGNLIVTLRNIYLR